MKRTDMATFAIEFNCNNFTNKGVCETKRYTTGSIIECVCCGNLCNDAMFCLHSEERVKRAAGSICNGAGGTTRPCFYQNPQPQIQPPVDGHLHTYVGTPYQEHHHHHHPPPHPPIHHHHESSEESIHLHGHEHHSEEIERQRFPHLSTSWSSEREDIVQTVQINNNGISRSWSHWPESRPRKFIDFHFTIAAKATSQRPPYYSSSMASAISIFLFVNYMCR